MSSAPAPEPGRVSKAVSAEIRAEMARLFLTGSGIAAKIGRSQNYLAKRLRDELPFSIDDVDAIAVAMGTSYERLMRAALERLRS